MKSNFLKKAIVISFVFIFLCANTEMGQLLKLPNLLHHFLEHQKEHDHHDDISLLAFIQIHYADKEHHHKKGDNEHQGLPFKTISHNTTILLAFHKTENFIFKENIEAPKSNAVVFSPQLYNSGVFANIWLPPKLS